MYILRGLSEGSEEGGIPFGSSPFDVAQGKQSKKPPSHGLKSAR